MTLKDRLREAKDALHALNTGQSVVEVTDQSGDRVRYLAANAHRLQTYINNLNSEINADNNPGPMRIWGR
ncbi:gpW family head-tail joining protein [Roseibium sediminis]|uniref:gpW family head-tail joining protein n=1 Tax=Roseibium sediminis TaxID=1775174 RepID=UPI00123CDFBB